MFNHMLPLRLSVRDMEKVIEPKVKVGKHLKKRVSKEQLLNIKRYLNEQEDMEK